MEFNSVLEKRESVRSFKGIGVDFRSILAGVDAAIKAPAAGNLNNMKFIIVENAETIGKIAGFCEQHWISEAPVVVVVCSDETNIENQYGERGRVYSRQQAGAAIENFLLAVVNLGLSACWVGAFSDVNLRQVLGIPENITIEAVIPVGYEKPGVKNKKKKKALEEALYWEKWETSKRPTMFKESGELPVV